MPSVIRGAANCEDRRGELWNSLLDAEMNVRFWSLISRRYGRWDKLFKLVVAFSSSGTVAAWSFFEAHTSYWKSFSALACVASIVHPFVASTEQLKRIYGVIGEWQKIAKKYELLWAKGQDLSDPKDWREFEKAKQAESLMAKEEAGLPVSDALLKK